MKTDAELNLASLTLTAGRDKSGRPEKTDIHFRPGRITALLGPTGSGKSRFLGDIESLAAGDTPTGRTLITAPGAMARVLASARFTSPSSPPTFFAQSSAST